MFAIVCLSCVARRPINAFTAGHPIHDDQTLLICVGGEKATWAQHKTSDWYDVFVPVADAVVDLYLQEHP